MNKINHFFHKKELLIFSYESGAVTQVLKFLVKLFINNYKILNK